MNLCNDGFLIEGGGLIRYTGGDSYIEIPPSVTRIGDRAFKWCSSLESIEIPSSVWRIGDRAFWNCESLERIEIPSSVTSIGNLAFGRCTALTDIFYEGSYVKWKSLRVSIPSDTKVHCSIAE